MRMIETTAIITDEGTLTVQVPLTTVPDVCSPSAPGLRLRPGACLRGPACPGGATRCVGGRRPARRPPELARRWRVGALGALPGGTRARCEETPAGGLA